MQKKQIAGWLMATVLVAGSGVALAEGGSNGPSLPDKANEHAVTAVSKAKDDPTTTEAADTEATEAKAPSSPSDANTNDNHGAIVSAAAQDHSHDAECGNHGKYVSAVAHGGTTCTSTTGAPAHAAHADPRANAKSGTQGS